MSRSPWADQSRRSDIRHLRDGTNHRSLTHRLTRGCTQTEWKHIAGYVARTHTQSQRTSKPGLRPRTRACSEKDVPSRERFPLNISSFSSFSDIIICMSAWWDDSHIDKTLFSATAALVTCSLTENCIPCSRSQTLVFPQGEKEPDVALPPFACLCLCSVSNCLCKRLWPVGRKWYRQQPFCICLY